MYELKPEDARDLARMFGEIDHENELEQIKKEQARQRLELLKIQTEKARQQLQTPPEREKATKTKRADAVLIVSMIVSLLAAFVPFIMMLAVFARY